MARWAAEDASLCSRLSLLEDLGIGESPFSLSMMDLLPDDLATLILAPRRLL